MSRRHQPARSIRRVLVTRLRFLGDVVMTTPMLETLREAVPDASIEYLTYEAYAPALDGNPNVDRVITMPPKAGVRDTLRVIRELRHPRIDWCFDTLNNPRSAILIALAAPRHSVGLKRGVRSWLYIHRRSQRGGRPSAVLDHLDKLVPLLGPVSERHTSLYASEKERREIAQRLAIDPGRELILLHPGASSPEKVWPVQNWPSLSEALQSRNKKARIAIVTQPGWEAVGREIVQKSPAGVEQLPELDARSLVALLTWTSLYVGNDGGILHCAVASRVPTVGLFGTYKEGAFFPYEAWGPYRSVVRCSDSGRDREGRPLSLLRDLAVDEVLVAVGEVLARAGASKRAAGPGTDPL